MLGNGEDELAPHLDTWKGMVDPEGRERTLALVQDLMAGHTTRKI